MKYLKLFEQFDEEEEAWWDEPDSYKDKLMLFRLDNGPYYVGQLDSDGNTVLFFENFPDRTYMLSRGWKICPIYDKKDDYKIYVYDRQNKYGGYAPHHDSWKLFKYKDLPKEIKDRLI